MKKPQASAVLDRHTKNVIYKTIKQIINTAKEEKKKAHIMGIQLEWEEFRKFTPMQIMGLLLLRDDALEKMQDFMFPTVAKSKGRLMTNANNTMSNNQNAGGKGGNIKKQ